MVPAVWNVSLYLPGRGCRRDGRLPRDPGPTKKPSSRAFIAVWRRERDGFARFACSPCGRPVGRPNRLRRFVEPASLDRGFEPAALHIERAPPEGIPAVWRRERDSNPRYAINVYSLSRGALSTTQPSLRNLVLCRAVYSRGNPPNTPLRPLPGRLASGVSAPRPESIGRQACFALDRPLGHSPQQHADPWGSRGPHMLLSGLPKVNPIPEERGRYSAAFLISTPAPDSADFSFWIRS
jgi:hypothetical protein